MFTKAELHYLESNELTRLATVNDQGQVDVVPVRYEIEDGYFYVGGQNIRQSRKYRNVEAGNRKVALVIDDLVPGDPPEIRGVRVYALADVVERDGWQGPAPHLRMRPTTHWSWGIEGPAFTDEGFTTNKVDWQEEKA